MSAFSGALSRALQIHSPAIPVFLGRPALEPVCLSGREGINGLSESEPLLEIPDALNLGATGPVVFHTTTMSLHGALNKPGPPGLELTNGAEFNLQVGKKLDAASKEQQRSNEGFRGPSGTDGRTDDYPPTH